MTIVITLMKFSSEGCAPCKKYDPIIQQVLASRDDVVYQPVDVNDDPTLAAQYEVQSVPFTVFLTEDGTILGGFKGPTTAGKLNKLIDQFNETE